MPFTPFHFGPCAAIGLPLQRHVDLPMLLLANVAVDLEPLLVLSGVVRDYPVHGYCHSLLVGTGVGLLLALACYPLRGLFRVFHQRLRIHYAPTLPRMMLWAVLGVWFHVLLDAPLYGDIRPFWPSQANPLYSLVDPDLMYDLCAVSFLPALGFLGVAFLRRRREA